MMSDTGMRPVAMNRQRGVAAGAIIRAQPVTETSLMESGIYISKKNTFLSFAEISNITVVTYLKLLKSLI